MLALRWQFFWLAVSQCLFVNFLRELEFVLFQIFFINLIEFIHRNLRWWYFYHALPRRRHRRWFYLHNWLLIEQNKVTSSLSALLRGPQHLIERILNFILRWHTILTQPCIVFILNTLSLSLPLKIWVLRCILYGSSFFWQIRCIFLMPCRV